MAAKTVVYSQHHRAVVGPQGVPGKEERKGGKASYSLFFLFVLCWLSLKIYLCIFPLFSPLFYFLFVGRAFESPKIY